mmetsp:Transcript_92940/g.206770  ORF Transcript_92940/g.206770 Transcript_92940/m.206770 type:complete len:408 (+) Transcript_92940:99-1322(+)
MAGSDGRIQGLLATHALAESGELCQDDAKGLVRNSADRWCHISQGRVFMVVALVTAGATLACLVGAIAVAGPAYHGDAAAQGSGSSRRLAGAASADTQTAHIVWKAHPDKCLAVAGDRKDFDGPHQLEIWDCPADILQNDRFLIPMSGKGYIRWALKPSLCLNAPRAHTTNLQLWDCDSVEPDHLMFLVNVDASGTGMIRKASDPSWCVDVPGEKAINGNRLQMWPCADPTDSQETLDQSFEFHHLVDCEVSEGNDCGTSVLPAPVVTTTLPPATGGTGEGESSGPDKEPETDPNGSLPLPSLSSIPAIPGLPKHLLGYRTQYVVAAACLLASLLICSLVCCCCNAGTSGFRGNNGTREVTHVWRFGRLVDTRRPMGGPYDSLNGAFDVQLDGRATPRRDSPSSRSQ